jgi:hypothetical protein
MPVDGLSARALLVAALVLVFLGAPPVVRAADQCTTMIPDMQAGYRALERGQPADADNSFAVSANRYATCFFPGLPLPPDDPRWATYWLAYAQAGSAAANFGDGKITDGLKQAKLAENSFRVVINGVGTAEGASDSLRRAASDGLVYVQSLISAKKPMLPKIWLDWKAAHPSG